MWMIRYIASEFDIDFGWSKFLVESRGSSWNTLVPLFPYRTQVFAYPHSSLREDWLCRAGEFSLHLSICLFLLLAHQIFSITCIALVRKTERRNNISSSSPDEALVSCRHYEEPIKTAIAVWKNLEHLLMMMTTAATAATASATAIACGLRRSLIKRL